MPDENLNVYKTSSPAVAVILRKRCVVVRANNRANDRVRLPTAQDSNFLSLRGYTPQRAFDGRH